MTAPPAGRGKQGAETEPLAGGTREKGGLSLHLRGDPPQALGPALRIFFCFCFKEIPLSHSLKPHTQSSRPPRGARLADRPGLPALLSHARPRRLQNSPTLHAVGVSSAAVSGRT